MDSTRLNGLSALDTAQAISDGAISAEQVMAACLARVREVDDQVQAWAHLDANHALARARARDDMRRQGEAIGPLHGVPVGIKDIIDTADMPTEDGTVLHAGRLPVADAAVVAALRAAGAVIMGKTVTSELATYFPGKTRNPHNPEHTPGGSSSGSAAAVAAGMVPLAVGSQTNGSVIRPAAYCGVYGFKPTYGLIPRSGVLKQSRALDQIGVFARTLEDIALMTELLIVADEADPDTKPRARIPLLATMREAPPLPPGIAFIKTPMWDRAEPETREAFAELVAHLGASVTEVELPESASRAWEWHRTVMEAEMAASYDAEWERGRDRLSDSLRAQLTRGRAISALDYQKALARMPMVNEALSEIFAHYDAILTPAAAGTAPRGLDSTGDPAFCTLWTFCGMPALNLPLMTGANGLPLGVQLVGPRMGDARLLRTARWLTGTLSPNP
jgi:Asp-tRNA(Asn)/Glu-tRNA(Gln) amidotransferase A subunit family amidase